MILYYTIFAVLLFASAIEFAAAGMQPAQPDPRRRSGVALAIQTALVILLLLLAAFRGNIGYDYFTYRDIFESARSGQEQEILLEPFYALLNSATSKITTNFTVFLLIISAAAIIPKTVMIRRFAALPLLGILIYFVNYYIMFDFGVLRQAVALALCALSLKYAVEDRPWPFFTVVLVAAMFHVTAVVFVFVYFVRRQKVTITKSVVIVGIALAISALIGPIMLSAVSAFGNSFAFLKLGLYLASDEYTAKVGLTVGFLVKLVIFLIYLHLVSHNNSMTPWRQLIINCYLGSLAGFIIFNDFGILAGRTFAYFKFVEVFLIPDLLLQSRKKWFAWPFFLAITLSLFTQLHRDLQMEYSDVLYPYEFSKDLELW